MDPFDDILPVAPAARTRPGGKFMPKAKSKQLPPKEISASEHATSSKDGNSENECQNATASAVSMTSKESMRSNHPPKVEMQNLEDATYSETRNPQKTSKKGDTVDLVDDHLPSTIAVSDIGADQNFTNLPNPAPEADPVDLEVGSVTDFIPETNLNNGTTQSVHCANSVENELNNVTSPSKTSSVIDGMQEPPKIGEGSFLDSNKCLELIDNSSQISTDVDLKIASDSKVATFESNITSKSNFGTEQEVVPAEFELDPFGNILHDPGARNARKFQPKTKPRPRVGNSLSNASTPSNVIMDKSVELPTSCMNEFQSSGDGNDRLNESTSLPLPTSEVLRTTGCMSSNIPFSEENRNLAAVIPSQLDSLNPMPSEVAAHNGTRDCPSASGKSCGEAADIFSGLESLDDFLTQPASDTGKPALHSFNEKDAEENFVAPACNSVNSLGVCDTSKVQRYPEYHTTQDSLTFNEDGVLNENDTLANNRRSESKEVVDLNPACPGKDAFDNQSVESGANPTSEIPVRDELTNAADSPTLADILHAEVTRVKVATEKKKDASTSSSQRKRGKSSITGEKDKGGQTSRQLRKRAARTPANSSLNGDVEDAVDLDPPYSSNGDKLEEDDDHDVDYSSKKKKLSTGSKKKSVTKTGKTSKKRKKANDNLEETTKEPPKKFSHSTRRRKRTVDKALLEIPEEELDPRTLPMKDIILLAEYRERLAKKEGTTSKTSSTYPSVGDSYHDAYAYNEEETFGSDDGRDPDDEQDNVRIPSTSTLFNYQSFMEKAPRGKWSKQDTELFYEAVRQFGTDFSMIQQLFPDKTRHQVKLKYKKEERQHPLQLSDAINNRSKDLSHFKLVIERLQQVSAGTKAEEDPGKDTSDFVTGEEAVELTPATNDEAATTEQDADVEAQEDAVADDTAQEDVMGVHSPEKSEDSDYDFQRWAY